MKYSKQKAYEQMTAVSLKSKKIDGGTEFQLRDVVPGIPLKQGTREIANDIMICTTNSGSRMRIPVREILKWKTQDNQETFSKVDEENISLPDKFKIVSGTDRKGRNGLIYPVQAYNLSQEFIDGKVVGWDNLVKGGLRENHGFDAVQDYVIAIL